jgi:hypothetical protein
MATVNQHKVPTIVRQDIRQEDLYLQLESEAPRIKANSLHRCPAVSVKIQDRSGSILGEPTHSFYGHKVRIVPSQLPYY